MNKAKQENNFPKKSFKKNVQQYSTQPPKSRSSTRDVSVKTNNTRWNLAGQPKMDGDKITQATVQAILATTGQESDYESDSDSDQLDINLVLNTQSDS